MKDLLLEIGSEEIPAAFMPSALKELEEEAKKYLQEKRISFEKLTALGTPRRLLLFAQGVAEKQEDVEELVKGPSVKIAYDEEGNLSKAGAGFARGQGVEAADLQVRELDGTDYIFALKKQKGVDSLTLFPEMFIKLIGGLYFPKPMRWEDYEIKFARPIRWLLGLYGDQPVDFAIEGLRSDNKTRGHRFLGQAQIEVSDVNDYFKKLEENFVIVNQDKRKEMILNQLKELEAKHNFVIGEDEDLLEEVIYLLEYPTALVGDFDEDFLKIPQEAVITPMKEHQRYFPVFDKDGKLLNHFVTVRNGNDQHLETVKAGNEKVLTARLKDAEFFFEEDKKIPLIDFTERLKTVVYQEELGTIYEKVERIVKNTEKIAQKLDLNQESRQRAGRAALLAKADLVTNMVYEFPELQGVMGQKYALISGEEPLLAQAIFEHYLPRFAGDILPETIEGKIISLADKMDTITGSFAIGYEPSGSQDPYALRRQALGICKIIIDSQLDLSLRDLIDISVSSLKDKMEVKEEAQEKIYNFFGQRLRNILNEEGFSYDVIEALLSKDYSSIAKLVKKAQALAAIKEAAEFSALHAGLTRANNISKKYEASEIDESLLKDPYEEALYKAYVESQAEVLGLIKEDKFYELLLELASLEKVINDFFDHVMVMAEDEKTRNNRIALVKSISLLADDVGDITKISL